MRFGCKLFLGIGLWLMDSGRLSGKVCRSATFSADKKEVVH